MDIEYAADTITAEDVIKHLNLTGGAAGVLAEVAARREAVKEAKALGLAVADAELQEFADGFRLARGLHAAEDMLAFLEGACLSVEDFEAFCESSLLVGALKDHWASEEAVREHFLAHRAAFDRARVSILVVATEGLAREIAMRTSEEAEDFHALVREHSVDQATRYAGGYAGRRINCRKTCHWILHSHWPPAPPIRIRRRGQPNFGPGAS